MFYCCYILIDKERFSSEENAGPISARSMQLEDQADIGHSLASVRGLPTISITTDDWVIVHPIDRHFGGSIQLISLFFGSLQTQSELPSLP